MKLALAVTLAALSLVSAWSAEPPLRLWAGEAPGEHGSVGEEKNTTPPDSGTPPKGGKSVIRLGNVSVPMLTVFRPAKEKDTGAAVLVCPGGGYGILAYDLEGSEVCEWLNDIGVTGILLKYRVPERKERPRYEAPVQDAQRALSLTRQHAAEWGLDPQRLGILGFSAGGHTAAIASNAERAYPAPDDTDKVDCRPNFTILIYPAYLVDKDKRDTLVPEVPVSAKTPPAFVAMTMDDGVMVEGAFAYALALKNVKVPCELHIYPKGGHGYGLRPSGNLIATWPARVADWMKASGWLKAK